MAYLEQLQAGLKHLGRAGESGRKNLDKVVAPVNGAISEIRGAATELENLPGVSPEMAARLQRAMRGIGQAQGKVNRVVSTYNRASRTLLGVDERLDALKVQVNRATQAVGKVAGAVNPTLAGVLPSWLLAPTATPPSESVAPLPHLLVLQPLTANGQPFYFNLDTAAFDTLQRTSAYNWSAQARLGRRPALQSVGLGEENILLKGAVFPLRRQVGEQKVVGLEQLEALRKLAERREPLVLSSGYGEVRMGLWCLVRISESQSALLGNGAPRKQTFDLEFKRYGDDLPNR
ncbi:phage tail protein [Pseudomonas paraeruginosa]|uniref:phage tail protein n=1 Tax=Pseudomonas aeruginosa group TaxID=136841 RepID=UPI00053E9330|nr:MULTISPECIES: phage tail protein [Pseudomonas aeruginosa group]MBG4066963.1 phage tail protein [Pseudomonas aeruginosa]MBG5599791.1 phage tail protein [Pseudomonas aeruginosa]MBH3671931.1 phage tail protein [Pseudomonas aeruginosa]MBH9432882.1 phage tail protein [Pseudomonas aeruginosa]MBI8819120.1 phage tail protein [Pseudomonas aeruginosa]